MYIPNESTKEHHFVIICDRCQVISFPFTGFLRFSPSYGVVKNKISEVDVSSLSAINSLPVFRTITGVSVIFFKGSTGGTILAWIKVTFTHI